MKIRKLNRNLHRDLGYLFSFMTIIYALSGIGLNHRSNWNPNFIIETKEINIDQTSLNKDQLDKNEVTELIKKYTPVEKYKNHYFPNDSTIKIFINGGNIKIDLKSGQGALETSKRRPVFHQFNYLHFNPRKWWTIISDIYAVSLMFLAISGLFILKGKNGIKGRGAWLTAIGIIPPIIFLLIYYWKVF